MATRNIIVRIVGCIVCSFVLEKDQKRWVWIALCHRTRQIVAFYIGKRDENAAR